ncbi:MAG: hypothetical protein ABI651_13515, partial [Verrucomicrobiota bacterium]
MKSFVCSPKLFGILAILIAFAWLAGASLTEAAALRLKVVVRTNDVATGSGAGLGQPDGLFNFTPPNIVPD